MKIASHGAYFFRKKKIYFQSSTARDPRQSKISRPIFSVENSGMSMNAPNIQSGRNLSPPPLPVLSTSDKATKMELEAILRKPAQTPEEKYDET